MNASQIFVLPAAITLVACALIMSNAASAGKRVGKVGTGAQAGEFRMVDPMANGSDEGGIAGVSYSENFEAGFIAGPGCGQNGWTGYCGPNLIDGLQFEAAPPAGFGAIGGRHNSDGSNVAGFEAVSPIFTVETGRLEADVIISDTASLYQVLVVNTTAGFFNTRLNFEASGVINVLTVDPACTVGTFAAATGTWTPGVKFRIGFDTDGTVLRIYKDGALIFTGTDINSVCAPAAAPGISQFRIFAANATGATTSNLRFDNISSGGGGPACLGDVTSDGQVNVADLLTVISVWGPCAGCPADVTGDGQVNVADLLTVISNWGPC